MADVLPDSELAGERADGRRGAGRAGALFSRTWFLLAFMACIAGAWGAPGIGAAHGPLHPQLVKPGLICAIFLVCGLTLPTRALGAALARGRVHAFVQGFSLIVIPAAFALLDPLWSNLGMPAPLRLGLLVLACLPTTISTCVALTKVAGGDEAVALCNSTLGNLLGVVATPLLVLALTGRHASLPGAAIAGQLGMMVVLPLAIGQLLRLQFAAAIGRFKQPFSLATSVLLLALIYLLFCDAFSIGTPIGRGGLLGVIALVGVLYPLLLIAAFAASSWSWLRMSRGERVAAAVCSTQKTAALGVPMVTIIFAGDDALPLLTLPLLLYHFVQLLVGTAVAPIFKRWATETVADGARERGIAPPPEPHAARSAR